MAFAGARQFGRIRDVLSVGMMACPPAYRPEYVPCATCTLSTYNQMVTLYSLSASFQESNIPSMSYSFQSMEECNLYTQLLPEIAWCSDAHDWKMDIVTGLLHRQDVLVITATGSGKTETFIRLMCLIQVLSTHPVSKDDRRLPSDPAMIVLCPTKALEEEMARK